MHVPSSLPPTPFSNLNQTHSVDIEHARALEDQWIESLDSTNPSSGSTSLSPSSDDGSAQFTHGILLGFFFPILPFFFMLRPNPPVFWEDGAMGERAKSVVFT